MWISAAMGRHKEVHGFDKTILMKHAGKALCKTIRHIFNLLEDSTPR